MATLLPNGEQTFVDANGAPLVGGKVYFYIPGTLTPKDTYQDAGASVLNTNPVVLDGAGRAIIYGSGAYRQIVKDASGNTIWDQITADTSSTQNSWAGTSTGSANAQAVTAAAFTSGNGQSISFIAGFTNTGAFSLNPNGAGPIQVVKDTTGGTAPLLGGEIVAGNLVQVVYDTTSGSFHLVGQPTVEPIFTLASGATTDLGTSTSRHVTVTGSNTITSFGSSAKTARPVYLVRFTGAVTLTHNATSLVLPGSANITAASGDTCTAIYLGAGNWTVTQYQRANGAPVVTKFVQSVASSVTAVATGTTVIPLDDTIPQSTEGDQYLTVTVSPTSTSNTLEIEILLNWAGSAAGYGTVALFQDSGTGALAAATMFNSATANAPHQTTLLFRMTAGTTSATTFKVRAGLSVAGTMTINGFSGGRIFGGVCTSSITVREIAP